MANKHKRTCISVPVDIDVDVDISDVLPEIDTEDLVEELASRKSGGCIGVDFDNPIQLRNKIGFLLGLREWDYSNKERMIQRLEELF